MPDDVARGRGEGVEEPWLLLELSRRRFALPLMLVDGVVEAGPIRRVQGAPPEVRGLAPWRGTVLTVLDLARIVDDEATPVRPCLVRLARPHVGTALLVPASLRVGWAPARSASEGRVDCEGASYERLDPDRLVRSIRSSVDG